MKRQKRVLSPSDNIGADTKIAPYCVAILAKVLTLSSTCDLRLATCDLAGTILAISSAHL